jgi:hypothetical protein
MKVDSGRAGEPEPVMAGNNGQEDHEESAGAAKAPRPRRMS